MSIKRKLTSRKFWFCVAAVLSSIGTAINGMCTTNNTLVIIGLCCMTVSSSIYTISEALVDGANVDSKINESEG